MSDCALLGGQGAGKAAARRGAHRQRLDRRLRRRGRRRRTRSPTSQDFAATAEGRAVLGRSGQPGRVRILDSQVRDGVLYVLVEDRGTLPIAGIDRRFWRAFLEVNGRMVALSELGFEGTGFSLQDGLNQMAALAQSIRAANPGG